MAIAAPLLVAGMPIAAAAAGDNHVCNNGPWSAPGGPSGKGEAGAVPGCTTRVSVTFNDADPNGTSQRPRISEDGNYIVFQSGADNLVSDFAAIRGTGTHDYWAAVDDAAATIQLVDRAADGGAPNSVAPKGATFVDVSPDGRFVVFYSTATNLVQGKTTRTGGNLFVRDMFAAGVQTIEVPLSYTGKTVNGYSNRPTIGQGDNGKYYIAYNSKGTNLVAGATHSNDAYVTELDPETFTVSLPKLLSHVPGATTPSDGGNEHAEISSDGSAIAWQSDATNLSPKANGKTQVYLSENPFMVPGADPVMVSVSDTGAAAGQPSTRPAINGNGDQVGFQSTANNLVPGDTNVALDVFVRGTGPDAFIAQGHTERVSLSYLGAQLAGASQRVNLSSDGSKVAFAANSAQTVKGDRNKARDVTLRDLRTGKNYLIDVCVAGTHQNGGFGAMTPPCVAQTGGPTNTLASGTDVSASLAASIPGGGVISNARPGGEDLSSRAFLSADGTRVAYISGMDDLVPNDHNHETSLDDVFVRTFTAF